MAVVLVSFCEKRRVGRSGLVFSGVCFLII